MGFLADYDRRIALASKAFGLGSDISEAEVVPQAVKMLREDTGFLSLLELEVRAQALLHGTVATSEQIKTGVTFLLSQLEDMAKSNSPSALTADGGGDPYHDDRGRFTGPGGGGVPSKTGPVGPNGPTSGSKGGGGVPSRTGPVGPHSPTPASVAPAPTQKKEGFFKKMFVALTDPRTKADIAAGVSKEDAKQANKAAVHKDEASQNDAERGKIQARLDKASRRGAKSVWTESQHGIEKNQKKAADLSAKLNSMQQEEIIRLLKEKG